MDVLGIGNAIVDVLFRADDDTIRAHELPKGGMTLIDEAQAEKLYAEAVEAGETTERSGGSVANTIAITAALGADAGYVGKVSDDRLGGAFTDSIRSHGVTFTTPALAGSPATARCLIMVTPDGERTMSTFLGACTQLGPGDVEGAAATVSIIEGYLADTDQARETFRRVIDAAASSQGKVALTLSDAMCVERHRDFFVELVREQVDILIADEDEVAALVGTDSVESLLADRGGHCEAVVVTHGAKGSTIHGIGGARHEVDARPAAEVLDTTGAGDAYAGGFLYGWTRGLDLGAAGWIGAVAASHVVAQIGAQPPEDLRAKVGAEARLD